MRIGGACDPMLCPIRVFGLFRHAYERMHNVFNNKTDVNGPVCKDLAIGDTAPLVGCGWWVGEWWWVVGIG